MKLSRSLLALMLASFLSILAVGCGNSSDDFVFTNNNNGVVNPNGNLTFRFTRAVTQQEVPADTIQLAFSLHSGSPPTAANLVETRLVAYNDVVVLEDVDPSVTTVVVTAVGTNGVPLVAYQGTTVVVPGTTQEVTLGNGTPITFDTLDVSPQVVNVVKGGEGVQLQFTLSFGNDTTIVLPSFNSPAASFSQETTVANISATGLVSTGVGGQNSTATAEYELFGTTRSDTFTINTFCFDLLDIETDFEVALVTGPTTDELTLFNARFIGPNGVVINFTENDDAFDNVTFALQSAPTGVTIDSDTGNITGANAQEGTAVILITYTDPVTGFSVTLSQEVDINEAE